MVGALLNLLHVQYGEVIDTFCDFLQTQKEQMLKDEKKTYGIVDESSSEQQFCKLDEISYLFCVKICKILYGLHY